DGHTPPSAGTTGAKMLRPPLSAVALVVVLAVVAAACAATGGAADGFAALPPADRELFQRCREPVATQRCRHGNAGAREACLTIKAEPFAGRRSDRTRRRWLESNGCPAA